MCFFFQAEDGIRDLVRSRGLGDVYKRQVLSNAMVNHVVLWLTVLVTTVVQVLWVLLHLTVYLKVKILQVAWVATCLLYTSDAADERSSVDLGGRRIIKKKKEEKKMKKKREKKKKKKPYTLASSRQ